MSALACPFRPHAPHPPSTRHSTSPSHLHLSQLTATDQQWSRITFWHLLPALCTATAHTDFRHSIVGDTHCIALACRVITCHVHSTGALAGEEAGGSSHHVRDAKDSTSPQDSGRGRKAAQDEEESEEELDAACNLACNLLLNVLVEDPSEARESATLAQLARGIAPALAGMSWCGGQWSGTLGRGNGVRWKQNRDRTRQESCVHFCMEEGRGLCVRVFTGAHL